MMSVEGHPEQALDRAISGNISDADRQLLNRHLAVCAACAAHLHAAPLVQSLRAPSVWDDRLNQNAIARVMASLSSPRLRWSMSFWGLARRRRWAIAGAIATLTAASVASATWWRTQRPEPVLAGAPLGKFAAAPSAGRRAPPLAPPSENPASLPEPAVAQAPPLGTTDGFERNGPGGPGASTLFARAMALRDRGQSTRALASFARLQRRFPETRETRLSFALMGRMLLDVGRPAEALAQFDRHLARGGEVSEEALAGRATALGRIGRHDAEKETWRRLLARYPQSVYAGQAKQRLAEVAENRPPP